MSLSSLSANTDLAYDGRRRSRDRRASLDARDATVSKGVSPPIATASPFDPDYYASRFKTDISHLKAFDTDDDAFPPGTPASATDADGDRILLDFFGNLSVLLVSVRAGNLERARSAADALELELLVESSAGSWAAPGRPTMIDDLRHLLSAAQSGDEIAARAAAQDLARDVKQSLDKPGAAASDAQSADATGSAYDALMAYIDDDAPSAA
jgi:hypothetical protein